MVSDRGQLSRLLCQDLEEKRFFTPSITRKLKNSGFSSLLIVRCSLLRRMLHEAVFLQILKHIPRAYIYMSDPTSMAESSETPVMLEATVSQCNVSLTKAGVIIQWRFQLLHGSESWTAQSSQFCGKTNLSRFVAQSKVKRFPVGTEVVVVGKVTWYILRRKQCEITLSRLMHVESLKSHSMLPIHRAKKEIKAEMFYDIVNKAIDVVEPLSHLDVYPSSIFEQYQTNSWLKALFTLHRPTSDEAVQEAKNTIKFHVRFLSSQATLFNLPLGDCLSAHVAAVQNQRNGCGDQGGCVISHRGNAHA